MMMNDVEVEVYIVCPETYIHIPLESILEKMVIHDTKDDYCYAIIVPSICARQVKWASEKVEKKKRMR